MVVLNLETVAMFAPWRSQKSLRKHKDPLLATHSLAWISQMRIIDAIIIRESLGLGTLKGFLVPQRVSCLHHVKGRVRLLNHLKHNEKVIRFRSQSSVKLRLLDVNSG